MLVAALIGTQMITPLPAQAVQDPFCGDVQLIWARGTGVPIGNGNTDVQFEAVDTNLRGNGSLPGRLGGDISYSSYQLGLDGGFGSFAYPAGGEEWGLFWQWADPSAGEYAESVAQGRSELEAYLNHRTVECSGEVFVLAGWSEGAQVIGESLADLSEPIQDRIAYVALFGDPTFTSMNAELFPFTGICFLPQQPWVRGTSDCYTQGIFGQRVPYVPAGMEARVGSWCERGDPACTGLFTDLPGWQAAHKSYFQENGDSAMAMQEAAESLKTFVPDQANDIDATFLQFATGGAGADLAFVFDTTGSMSGEITDAKAQATALANLWLALSTNGRVALVEFRDQGDLFVSRIDQPLTSDPSAFQAAVNGLAAAQGGDWPEAQLSGLMTALDGLAWQDGAIKIGIIITDASGKDPEPVTGYTRAAVIQHSLEIDPVALYGVDVVDDPEVRAFMQPLADGTAGEVFVLGSEQSLSDLLADVINSAAMSPVAHLGGPYYAFTGDPVFFTARGSFDPDGDIASYEWDFDADGTVDQTTTTPSVDYTYPSAFSGLAAVRVVSSDGGEALATASVTVDSAGFTDVLPVAPTSATATVSGPDQVTVSWTPAVDDQALGYKITATDNGLSRYVETGGLDSVVIDGLDLSYPRTFTVRASNEFGDSAAATTQPVGGIGAPAIAITSAWARFLPPGRCDPFCPLAPAQGTVTLAAAGNATANAGVVTVDYRLWGLPPTGDAVLLDDWTPADPTDGAFDSSMEAFFVSDARDNAGYTAYRLDVRASAGGSSATVSQDLPFEHDTVAPTSSVNALPASTTTSP